MLLLLALLTLQAGDSTKFIVVDYESNEPLIGVQIYENGEIKTRSNNYGEATIIMEENPSNYEIRYIGFHNTIIQGINMMELDTLFLFESTTTFSERGTKFKRNKNIKKGKIVIERASMTQEFIYNEGDKSLTLEIKNAR